MVQGSAQSRKNNEAARIALADILTFEVSDPRLQTLTVSGVTVSSDRSVVSAYILADRVVEEDAMAGLESAKGRIRSLLGARLGWKNTPQIRFFMDSMMEDAARIDAVLADRPPTLEIEKDDEGHPIEEESENL
jgi:ribosome-binding factor A